MGALHWLILFPYYFFTALTVYLVLVVACRIVRAQPSANPLATTAVVTGVVLTALPFVASNVSIDAYGWQGLVFLLVVSLALATVDTVLKSSLPLPLDQELEDV